MKSVHYGKLSRELLSLAIGCERFAEVTTLRVSLIVPASLTGYQKFRRRNPFGGSWEEGLASRLEEVKCIALKAFLLLEINSIYQIRLLPAKRAIENGKNAFSFNKKHLDKLLHIKKYVLISPALKAVIQVFVLNNPLMSSKLHRSG